MSGSTFCDVVHNRHLDTPANEGRKRKRLLKWTRRMFDTAELEWKRGTSPVAVDAGEIGRDERHHAHPVHVVRHRLRRLHPALHPPCPLRRLRASVTSHHIPTSPRKCEAGTERLTLRR